MPVVTNIADLRRMAKKRVAKAIFDYVDRGSYDEHTLRANTSDLDALACDFHASASDHRTKAQGLIDQIPLHPDLWAGQ